MQARPFASVLITGAGSGIGLRLSELLAARGATVLALDRRLGANALAAITRASIDRSPIAIDADVTDGQKLAAAVAAAVAQIDRPLDLVINCAGILAAGTIEELDEQTFRNVIDVNLVGSRNVAVAVLPHLRRGGRLALIASLAGQIPSYGYGAYGSSKFGVIGLGEVLRLELAPRGIAVSLICPPEVKTPMLAAERATITPTARKLKAIAGTIELDVAAAAILDGLDRQRYMIAPTFRARALTALVRYAPRTLVHRITDSVVKRTLRH